MFTGKVESKVTPVHTMKAYVVRSLALEVGDDLHALDTLCLPKNPNTHCIGDCGAHSQSGHFREEKISWPCWNLKPRLPSL